MVANLLWMMLAGALGTLSRFGLATLVNRWGGEGFPWGIFAVNAVGCLAFGVVFSLTESRLPLGPQTRLIVLTGFLGAFTTFSTFAFDSADLMLAGKWALAVMNAVAQTAVGVMLVLAGLALGRLLT